MRLLDASDARVVMLVAPAGYGKTTLAGQWLETKHHALYRATPAARDVAALIGGLAEAAASVGRADPTRVLQRLAHAADPERELSEFLPLMNALFETWPNDAWLAIDDYHYIVGSNACEAIVEALWARSRVKIVIATRRRPTWASARRLLYGDLFELGPDSLTMSVEEANSVLHSSRAASRLVALANGWPAVVGLAAMAEPVFAADDRLERDLYDYFAEELLAATTVERRAQLAALAVPPSISQELAYELFGPDAADATLRDAVRLGFATPVAPRAWQLHPLLRQFLLTKFREFPRAHQDETVESVVTFLRSKGEWDDAFAVLVLFERVDMIDSLLGDALPEMLKSGRLSTLRRWLDFGAAATPQPASMTVVDAELAFRQGKHADAEALAREALRILDPDHRLRPSVLFRAGQAAYFRGHEAEALAFLEQAISAATDQQLAKEARWAAFVTAVYLDTSRASDLLREFEESRERTIDDSVRLANARLLLAIRSGGIDEALRAVATTAKVADRANDPMIKTAFWNVYAWALVLNARYATAVEAARRERQEAELAGLSFVLPHAAVVEAVALAGLRDSAGAEALMNGVSAIAADRHDGFLSLSAALVRARLSILLRGPIAERNTIEGAGPTSDLTLGEYLGLVAIARAAAADREGFRAAVAEIGRLTDHAEPRALVACGNAVLELATGGDGVAATEQALSLAFGLGQRDSVVLAYRAFPPLIAAAIAADHANAIATLLEASNDSQLALSYGLHAKPKSANPYEVLSRRERQVLELLARGRTNDEIATALFISPVTVKAHLRRIYGKLGVRNRVEAAAALPTEQPPLPA